MCIYKPRGILRQRALWVDSPVYFEIPKSMEKRTDGRTVGRTKVKNGGRVFDGRFIHSFIHPFIHSFEKGQRD
jgi:hypothetical protein